MRKSSTWCVVGVLILGLALLAVSCGGTTSAPTEKPAAEEPAAEEPAAGGATAITHSLEGRDDCLMCHGEGAAKAFPADHAGRTNEGCLTCHE